MNQFLGYCKLHEFIILTAHNANAIPCEDSVNERANERLASVLFGYTNLENINTVEGYYGGMREESFIASVQSMHPGQNSRAWLVHLLREFNQESGIHYIDGEFHMVYSDGRSDLVAVGVRFVQGEKNRPQDNYSRLQGTEEFMQIEFEWPE